MPENVVGVCTVVIHSCRWSSKFVFFLRPSGGSPTMYDSMGTGTGSSGYRWVGMQRNSKFDYLHIISTNCTRVRTHTHAQTNWGSPSDSVGENETGYTTTQGFVLHRASQLCYCPRTCVNPCSAENHHRAHLSLSSRHANRMCRQFDWPAHSNDTGLHIRLACQKSIKVV